MGESLLTTLSMDTATAHHPHQGPSTFLSMDTASHDDFDLFLPPPGPFRRCLHAAAAVPPDINLPLDADPSPPPPPPVLQAGPLHDSNVDMLDVGLGGPQLYDSDSPAATGVAPAPAAATTMVAVSHTKGSNSSAARKCVKRNDTIWGAWFFFTHYFKPVMSADKGSKAKVPTSGGNGNNATLDAFLVQHDMENMYMWVFKERPENALGKMQLRSFMNGHSRLGEPQFPFSAEKGFVRSHRMQRKHYRGLSNPQCLHGIEIVRAPNLSGVPEADLKRWTELTGRDANFSVDAEASDYESWRNLPSTDFELERPATAAAVKSNSHGHHKKLLNGSGLNLSTQPSNYSSGDGLDIPNICNKRRKDSSPTAMEEDCSNSNSDKVQEMDLSHTFEPSWMNDFTGVMCHASGPVTAAKTIYEDSKGYLIIISLPFADIQRVKVSWKNTLTNGIVKVSCTSVGRMPFLKRHDRTFKLVDPSPEHCPPGEFIREIPLPTRIPEDATLEAYCDESGTGLEIIVPKYRVGPEEHEVHVSMRPPSSWCQS
ncbi:hypothetical protein E2562_032980 [Oryza meyeriana var. granulata]|uniref:SHSP domain-containing protein n=1 Tax=Oryza meyeriana var. granulata TaxID=110450 RepID=A0A6G1CVR4_9ORYZ|nr:hypothetical protein E2562_032980 [Oryza meyeriana var. granulata]KAF0904202.1 hypothetical protein E2562_032980 [Oryza meyeriana var. granulata]